MPLFVIVPHYAPESGSHGVDESFHRFINRFQGSTLYMTSGLGHGFAWEPFSLTENSPVHRKRSATFAAVVPVFGHTGVGEEGSEPATDCQEAGDQPQHGEEVH
jgi:hypothetical protein